MEQTNGTTPKKQVLFSIGSYSEKDRRVINKISPNGLFSAPSSPSPLFRPPSLSYKAPRPHSEPDFPKYNTLPPRPKQPRPEEAAIEKPVCPPNSDCLRLNGSSGPEKPERPPRLEARSLSLEPEQLRNSGRVALTIAAYEGEPRTPTRLEFLPQTKLSRSSSKAGSDVADGEHISFKLQNELVATLKRSNLKRRSDNEDSLHEENGEQDENGKNERSEENGEQDENGKNKKSGENGISDSTDKEKSSKEMISTDGSEIPNGNVKQLASELDKIMTFNINQPENGEQISDKTE